jgi:hypothetical protein
MTTIQQLEFIVSTINSTEEISNFEFNFNDDVRKVFLLVYKQDDLKRNLEREHPNYCNKFCNLDSILLTFIEKNNVELGLANDYLNKIGNNSTRNWEKIDLVKLSIEQNKIEIAERITSEIPDGDSGASQYVAHRHFLNYYASIGDVENFKKKTKQSKLGRFPRYGIEAYKSNLLEGYAKNYGIHKAFELANEKYFENTNTFGIIYRNAHLISIKEIDNLIIQYSRAFQNEDTKAWLYVAHFKEKGRVNIPEKEYEMTLNEILKIDKTDKCGDIRCRDILVMDLCYTTLNKKQALELKKLLISPKLKSEFNSYIKQQTEENKYIS